MSEGYFDTHANLPQIMGDHLSLYNVSLLKQYIHNHMLFLVHRRAISSLVSSRVRSTGQHTYTCIYIYISVSPEHLSQHVVPT